MDLLTQTAGSIEIFLQLLLAASLGMFLGVERSVAGKTAGMRTFGLVSLASCLFVIISVLVANEYVGITTFDPLRVASNIVVGIGFIGAGLIIFQDKKLHGLTTAAGLWVAAGIGAAVGFQLYAIALFTTVLTLFAFTVLWRVENYMEAKLGFKEDNEPSALS